MCTPRNLVLLTLSTVAPLMVKRSMLSVHSPEVNNNLLRLLHIQREIVVTAPPGQAAHLAPVVCLISVANETHHSRVIRKLNERLELWDGVQSWVSRVKRRRLSTHPWGAPVFNVMVVDVLMPTRTAWGLPVRKSNSQLHRGVEPQLDQFVSELLRDDCVECWTELTNNHSEIRRDSEKQSCSQSSKRVRWHLTNYSTENTASKFACFHSHYWAVLVWLVG